MSADRRRVVGLVCARGGSKGVPRKNLRALGGKPLVGWAIDTGRACPEIDDVVVSTDDPEIATVARAHGARVPFMRPADLAKDDSPEWAVWQHAVRALSEEAAIELVVVLPPTAPLRSVDDVTACLRMARQRETDLVITVAPAARNPYFNMVRIRDGFAVPVIEPSERIVRRQDAPLVYDMTTVAYVATPDYVLRHDRVFGGRVRAVVVPPERAVDIDSELDLAVAEVLLERARASGSR